MKRVPKPPALDPGLLLRAYSEGFFPMADEEDGSIAWHSPDPRAVIPLDGLRVTRSLQRTVDRGTYTVTTDLDFPEVISQCAERDETWISPEIQAAYIALWKLGHGHSVECRQGDLLAGGLYGVSLGGAFFGESMFSLRSDASKVALVHLDRFLRVGGFTLLDVQFLTPHLATLGAVEIPRVAYLGLLSTALTKNAEFPRFGGKSHDSAY